jgi:hypothetical protein
MTGITDTKVTLEDLGTKLRCSNCSAKEVALSVVGEGVWAWCKPCNHKARLPHEYSKGLVQYSVEHDVDSDCACNSVYYVGGE